jgi:hypothetical protein
LQVAEDILHDFSFDTHRDFVIFQVRKLWPERRYHVKLQHMSTSTTTIHVSRQCVVTQSPEGTPKIVVGGDYAENDALEVLHLVGSMKLSLQTLFRWQAVGRLATGKPNVVRESASIDTFCDTYEQPSIVGEHANPSRSLAPASSSSQAIVQFDSAMDQAVIRELMVRKAILPGRGLKIR